MVRLQVNLLGKFCASRGEQELVAFRSGKVKELLCYLLLHHEREHAREVLAARMWGECTTPLSKKYLRQALWQIHQGLRDLECESAGPLHADAESVRLDLSEGIDLDVENIERAFQKANNLPASRLDEGTAEGLHRAVALYRGELLPGCYLDWCLYHRERLQNMYLTMLDTLMAYSELHAQYESGKELGERSLKEDPARERTYVRLMRLDFLSGDRGGALRRFQKCEAALREELNVRPSRTTLDLCEQIRSDTLSAPVGASSPICAVPSPDADIADAKHAEDPALPLQKRLENIRALLVRMRQRIQLDIKAVDDAISLRDHTR